MTHHENRGKLSYRWAFVDSPSFRLALWNIFHLIALAPRILNFDKIFISCLCLEARVT